MNVHAIVSKCISAINPSKRLTFRVSKGAQVVDEAGNRFPETVVTHKRGQVQSTTSGDLQIMTDAGLNLQGYHVRFYVNGAIEGLERGAQGSGTLMVTPDGRTWKVTMIDEIWPDWTGGLATLQLDKTAPRVVGALTR